MSNYTDVLEAKMYDITPDDDNYRQELIDIAKSFRRFDEALDTYIIKHGYEGKSNDIDSKVAFLKNKFKEAEVPIPRNLRKWFSEHKSIERKTSIQLCFAFELTLEESEDFLRRICLQRSFDCHDPEELIYYFAISHNMKYQVAKAAIDKLEFPRNSAIIMNEDVLYTSIIVEEIGTLENLDEVVDYIGKNRSQFGYNNVTASKYIITLWNEIEGTEGIAKCEEELFEGESFTGIEQSKSNKDSVSNSKELSLWNIYLQILGLRGEKIKKLGTDRSLKPILKNNVLLHPLAEASFPDRDGLTKILKGVHVSDERIRKTLILLAFYKYWGSIAIKSGSYLVNPKDNDADRCCALIDRYLSDAGYPSLYPGNPFDWLIKFSSIDEQPLSIFRDFMLQMFYIKQNSDEVVVQYKE